MNKTCFKPAWWLSNSHLQTMWPTLCRRRINKMVITRERMELADGDFVDLDWVGLDNISSPIVIILHGLEGSVNSPYAKGMLQAVEQQGWRGVLMHFRCCSGELNRLPRMYHSGETGDLAQVVNNIGQRENNVSMAAIGFSLGGNVLLKWLGESSYNNPLKAAVAISVPFELSKSVERINQGFSKLYQKRLLNNLYKKIQRKLKQQWLPIPPLAKLHTLRDFDEQVTAPLHGFSNADAYYHHSSSRQYLHKIAIPTLIIQSEDDPFMTKDLLPQQAELSEKIVFELTRHGGHVGFVSGCVPWHLEYWLEKRAPQFLRQQLLE